VKMDILQTVTLRFRKEIRLLFLLYLQVSENWKSTSNKSDAIIPVKHEHQDNFSGFGFFASC
jgi:hypothetical protein